MENWLLPQKGNKNYSVKCVLLKHYYNEMDEKLIEKSVKEH